MSLPGDPISIPVCSLPTLPMDAHQLVLVIAESREESRCTKSDSTNIDRVTT